MALDIGRSLMIPSRTFIAVLTLLAALALPSVSLAFLWDGYELKKMIDAADRVDNGNPQKGDINDLFTFIGFVAGVHDAFDDLAFCTPGGVRLAQLIGVVKKYVRENPDEWNYAASLLVIAALSSAFPCNK